ncbi:MAG: hypothetical protein DYG92_10255 [Leptolyngbya sp. PLA1]|nr:hypothetical protein [Leptolyngbya sp. PLA1]
MPSPTSPQHAGHSFAQVLQGVARQAAAAGVFGSVEIEGARLSAAAKAPAAPAWYRLAEDGGTVWVSLVTPDRWLSHSVEADLLNTGDSLGELIREELAELGEEGAPVVCEHFRDQDRLFTFRTPVPARDEDTLWRYLRAYEECFRRLGDIDAAE